MRVYTEDYGLRPFKATEKWVNSSREVLFKGKYKLPKDIGTINGKKWIEIYRWIPATDLHTGK